MRDIDTQRKIFIDILSCMIDPLKLTKEDILGIVILCNTLPKMDKMVEWLKEKIPHSEKPKVTITRNELWRKAVEIQREDDQTGIL